MTDGAKAVFVTVGVILVVAAVSVGSYFLWWGVHGSNINRDYQTNTHSLPYQESLISAERDRATNYDAATDPGQRAVIKSQFCSVFVDLTQPPNDLVIAAHHIGC